MIEILRSKALELYQFAGDLRRLAEAPGYSEHDDFVAELRRQADAAFDAADHLHRASVLLRGLRAG